MKCLLPFILSVLLLFSGCSAVEPESSVLDTTQVSVLAQQQLDEEFADIAGFQREQKSIYIKNADPSHIIVVFTYRSEEGDGEYGLEYAGNAQEGYRLLQKGPEVTGKLLDKMTQEKAS